MPRLLHIMDYEPRGTRTIDHFIIGLTRAMKAEGWEILFAFGTEPPDAFRLALAEAGGSHVVIPFPFTNASAGELIRRSDGYRPDVTQTSFLSAFCKPLLKLKLAGRLGKLIVIDHSSGAVPIRGGWKRRLAKLRGWAVGKIVDAIVPVSEAIARRDIKDVHLPAAKIRVVYNGIVLDRFPMPVRVRRGDLRVVYAGQLIPEKGVRTLLQAHAILRSQSVSGYELLIAGRGPQEAELKDYCRAEGLDDVRFLGHVDSIAELFGSADIVIVPSIWFEAFGLVLIEAMACGACCLVSDAGALAEVVGEAGVAFRAGDAADLAAEWKGLLTDDRRRGELAASGRKRVESTFDIGTMVRGHADICLAIHRPNGRPTRVSGASQSSGGHP